MTIETPALGATTLLLDWRRARFGAASLAAWLEEPSSRLDPAGRARLAAAGLIGTSEGRRLFDVEGGIAYIPIRGALFNDDWIDPLFGYSGYKGLSAIFAAAMADQSVEAILFDIDSPGGMASGLFDLVDEIHAGRGQGKPIWALANDVATSAAYAIASAADRVFLPRLGAVGSIGVWTLHLDLSRFLEEAGFKVTLVFAGDHKVDGNPFNPLPDSVKAEMQADIDHTHDIFIETVARNRGLDPAAVRVTQARIFDDSAGERNAVAAGLADGVATDKAVVAALIEELQAAPAD